MKRWVMIVTWAADVANERIDSFIAQMRQIANHDHEIHSSHAGSHLPGSVGEGDCTWDLTFDEQHNRSPLKTPSIAKLVEQYQDAISKIDEVPLLSIQNRILPVQEPVIKRTLLLRLKPNVTEESKQRFEKQMMQMPDYISAIRSWSFSKVDHTLADSAWSYVWEQEFESLEGLNVDYMIHPYHITLVDTWFDSENPKAIAEPLLAHLFYRSPQSVIHA